MSEARQHQAHEGPLRVLVGNERFSENHAWSELPQHWPSGLAGRSVIEVVGQGQLEARLVDGGPPVDVVVPMWSPLPGRAIQAGGFGLVQQFGVGVDNIDLEAAAHEGVWVANMPGLNAVPVAEHAVALLLALARRLPEAPKGFEPGRWGQPAGRSLAGTAACIVGAGAVGTEIARRLAAFDVTVTGVRRHPPSGPVLPFAAVYTADRILDCVADADAVIIAAGHQPGQPPLVDDTVLRAMRPGAWLVNIARGALLDADAALAHLNTGHLAGIGLDVFAAEPYPANGPLFGHPRIVATAHTASLTSDYFAAASRRLGDAITAYLNHQPPAGLLTAPSHTSSPAVPTRSRPSHPKEKETHHEETLCPAVRLGNVATGHHPHRRCEPPACGGAGQQQRCERPGIPNQVRVGCEAHHRHRARWLGRLIGLERRDQSPSEGRLSRHRSR